MCKFAFPLSILFTATLISSTAHAANWSASVVDWAVSRDYSAVEKRDACEIHWKYDEAFDVGFHKSQQKEFYLTLKILDDSIVEPLMDGQAYQGTYYLHNGTGFPVSGSLKRNRLEFSFPPEIVSLQYFKTSSQLVLSLGKDILQFPIENAAENFNAFDECLGTLSGANVRANDPVYLNEAQQLESMEKSAIMDNSVPLENIPSVESEEIPAFAPQTVKSLETEEALKDADAAVLEKVANKTSHNSVADLDDSARAVTSDAAALPVEQKTNVALADTSKYALQPVVGEDPAQTKIMNNLMKKLTILEREKEDLRRRLLGMEKTGLVSEIIPCRQVNDEQEKNAADKEALKKLEEMMSALRQENKELKASLGDSSQADALREENKALQDQLEQLLKENSNLQLIIDHSKDGDVQVDTQEEINQPDPEGEVESEGSSPSVEDIGSQEDATTNKSSDLQYPTLPKR